MTSSPRVSREWSTEVTTLQVRPFQRASFLLLLFFTRIIVCARKPQQVG